MACRFLLDEHLRGGGLWKAILRHNSQGIRTIDAVRLGDPTGLPLGISDPDLLLWAEREGRILVSLDKGTLPNYLAAHLYQGHHSPGVLMIRSGSTVPQVLSFLVLAAHAGDPADFKMALATFLSFPESFVSENFTLTSPQSEPDRAAPPRFPPWPCT